MSNKDRRRRIHDLDATLRVGKQGIEPVADELSNQLDDRDLVKVKFLRATLADMASATVVQTRGHTAVFER
jgi:RNA-binding protein